MPPKTMFEKIWEEHLVHDEPGEPSIIYIDLHLVHEVTSAQAFDGLRDAGRRVRRLDLTVATADHNTPTWDLSLPVTDEVSKAQLDALDRNCADGSVLTRNTLRKDNAFVQWDIRFSKLFRGRGDAALELIVDIFNVTNSDNFLDPTFGELLFNFDGTVQSGLGTPRSVQVGARVIF